MIKHRDLTQYNWYKYAVNGFTEIQRTKYARTVSYYTQMYRATPSWAVYSAILDLYLFAALLRRQGTAVEIDHIVPLMHPHVCGLHCLDNLRVIPRAQNQRKSNKYWPGMWEEQLSLFDAVPDTQVGKLESSMGVMM